ncbi:hypothetical protein DAI22_04g092700 [Oryza sativa Japonica Group]|nr:hypothetical protein DAI22_04g092700 [Oryza sativa Japonica Group]
MDTSSIDSRTSSSTRTLRIQNMADSDQSTVGALVCVSPEAGLRIPHKMW